MRAAGGTFISARTLRTLATRSISQFISVRASSCAGKPERSGQGESISMRRARRRVLGHAAPTAPR